MNEIIDLVKAMNKIHRKDNYHIERITNTIDKELDYDELTEWCEQNCKHPWKGIINEGFIHGTPDFTFLFKHDDDAVFFKLIWG